MKGDIHEFSTENKTHKIIPVHENVGAISICRDGNIFAALKNGFAFINRENGLIETLANPEKHLQGNRLNDGKCEPQ